MKQCPVCKKSLPDDSDFCQYCGTKINTVPEVQKSEKPASVPHSQLEKQIENSQKKVETKPSFVESLASRKDEEIEEKKTKKFGGSLAAWICAGVLIAALIVGNIIQAVNAQKKDNQANSQITALEEEVRSCKEENDSLSQKIATLESEKHDLEEQAKSIATLESEKSQLEKQISEWEAKEDEYDDLLKRILDLNTENTNLNSQISSLKQSNTSLRNQLDNYKNTSGKATTAYNAIKSFNYGTYYDDYHAETEIVVVKVGHKKTFHITAKMNSTIYFSKDNYNSSGECQVLNLV